MEKEEAKEEEKECGERMLKTRRTRKEEKEENRYTVKGGGGKYKGRKWEGNNVRGGNEGMRQG